MAFESEEVRAFGTGHVYVADVGTAMPADIGATIPTSWIDLGYTDEQGPRFNFGRTVNEVPAWQSYDPVRVLITAVPKTVAFDLLQTNKHTLQLALGGGDVTEGAPFEFSYEPPDESFVDERALIITGEDGDYTYRFCFHKVLNQSGVEFPFVRGAPTKLAIEVKVLAAGGGNKPYFIQTDDPNIFSGAAS